MPVSRRIPLSAKGDLLSHNGTRLVRLPAGTNGQALIADSGEASGLKFGAVSGGGDAPSGVTIDGEAALAVGGDLLLTCSASGAATLHYQWFRGATEVGTDSPVLSVEDVDADDAGDYRCEVTNEHGDVFSDVLAVTVLVPPSISAETPPDEVPTPNEVIEFVVTAAGDSLAYQWQKLVDAAWVNVTNGGLTAGATTATLELQANSTNEGSFRCRVTNAVGQAASSTMTFYVSAPEIVTQPDDIGEDGTTAIVASGHGTLSYQWRYGGAAISGQTTDTLDLNVALASVDLTLGRKFTCAVSNPAGIVVSDEASCRPFQSGDVSGGGAKQRAQPTVVVLVANLTGPPGTSYSWKRDGVTVGGDVDIFGDSVPTLTIPNIQLADEGTYVCTATNAFGSAESDEIEVTVSDSGSVHSHPGGLLYVFDDETVAVNVEQLFTGIPGASGAGYYQRDLGWIPVVDSDEVWADVQSKLTYAGPTNYPGGTGPGVADSWHTVALSLDGAALAPVTTWQLAAVSQSGVPDPGDLLEDPFIEGASPAYSVTIESRVITKAAVSDITSGPIIAVLGEALEINLTATGDNLTYAWYRDSVRLALFTTATLSRANASPDDSGSYVAKAGNQSYNGAHVAASDAVVVNVVGILATPAPGGRCTADEITAEFCGGENVEFARFVDGVMGDWQDSPTFTVGEDFGTWKIRVRSTDDTAKFHDSGEFAVSQIFKWRVDAPNDWHTLHTLFDNGGDVTFGSDTRTLPTATATGQTHAENAVPNHFSGGTHTENFTSV